jgi:hypothetical protein
MWFADRAASEPNNARLMQRPVAATELAALANITAGHAQVITGWLSGFADYRRRQLQTA